jgi:uncharacterized protein (TIGR03085 family)
MLDRAEQVGASAPTLCGGWDVHDLLAHVWVREHEPIATPGLVIPAVHDITERRERAARARFGFDELVRSLRSGMPLLPLGAPGVRDLGNVHEFFVHHEDIRRANGDGPRVPVDPQLAAALWARLRASAPLLFRRARSVSVRLERPDGATIDATPLSRGPKVRVVGEVPELFLFAFNRKDEAAVEVRGDDAAVAKLRSAPLGL